MAISKARFFLKGKFLIGYENFPKKDMLGKVYSILLLLPVYIGECAFFELSCVNLVPLVYKQTGIVLTVYMPYRSMLIKVNRNEKNA